MMDLENIEATRDVQKVEESPRLTDSQQAYLKELDVPAEGWARMDDAGKAEHLDLLLNRAEELNMPAETLAKSTNLLSPEMLEDLNRRLEAPNDMVQIEQVSDVLAHCEDLRFENWQHLELSAKVDVLNRLEGQIAHIEHRPPCPIRARQLEPGMWGGYNPGTKTIDINADYIERSGHDRHFYREIVDTLVHEGRHAYQDYNVHVRVVHPRQAEVNSWAETMADGKWGYWGDCSSVLGQRLYEQQSVEIDARNFAADVVDKLNDKLQA